MNSQTQQNTNKMQLQKRRMALTKEVQVPIVKPKLTDFTNVNKSWWSPERITKFYQKKICHMFDCHYFDICEELVDYNLDRENINNFLGIMLDWKARLKTVEKQDLPGAIKLLEEEITVYEHLATTDESKISECRVRIARVYWNMSCIANDMDNELLKQNFLCRSEFFSSEEHLPNRIKCIPQKKI